MDLYTERREVWGKKKTVCEGFQGLDDEAGRSGLETDLLNRCLDGASLSLTSARDVTDPITISGRWMGWLVIGRWKCHVKLVSTWMVCSHTIARYEPGPEMIEQNNDLGKKVTTLIQRTLTKHSSSYTDELSSAEIFAFALSSTTTQK